MGLWGRLRSRLPESGGGRSDDRRELREWAASHRGVEAFVEPATTVTSTTVVLVDAEGAWTRGRVRDPAQARRFARGLGMPVYDVRLVGYPQRRRDHDARARIMRERARRDALG